MKTKFIIATLIASTAGVWAQDEAPIQLSLTPDIAVQSRDTTINGLSLNIWGENPQHGLTIGIVNGSTGDSAGFSWGVINYADSYSGVSWGLLNVSSSSFVGWQHGWINVSQGTFAGFQSGWVCNFAEEFHGLQLGFLNYAGNLQGVQLGFINIAANNPWFDEFPDKLATGFPIFNWSF
ncbi:MAG: hypothetical protein ABSA45_03700 [Verrucomicrobiota bacterium]|jgi:hypothetical protein